MSKIRFQSSKGDDVVVIDLETSKISVHPNADLDEAAQTFIACLESAILIWKEKSCGDDPFREMLFQGAIDSDGGKAGDFILRPGAGGSGNDGGDGGDVRVVGMWMG